MLFNSFTFLIFFPIVVSAYYLLAPKLRWIILLISSYYFYMCWNTTYVLLLIISTLADYFCALLLFGTQVKWKRRSFLALSLIVNLGLLFFYKYYHFATSSAENVLGAWNIAYHFPQFDLLLPVGISFYTFQTLSYTIDVYRGHAEPERHLGRFALYVSFFPQLVAGPIERSHRLLPELKKWVKFNYENIRNGLVLMAWGFFKKLVIADRLAEYVNVVYNRPSEYDGLPTLLATYFFSFQIYCDFSGYSDIAIGAALVLGVHLMTNFRQPYFSKNIGEFWNRWHISLSTWFRDYLYIPLGGNRVVTSRLFFNVLIVFLISGIWHGANWTFAIWGLLHGIYLVITIVSRSFSSRISSAITGDKIFSLKSFFQIFLTYHLVLFGWIFFRSATLNDALLIFDNIISRFSFNTPFNLFRNSIDFGISLSCIGMLLAVEYLQQTFDLNQKMEKLHYLLKWILLGALLFSIFTLGKFEGTDFLYFQF